MRHASNACIQENDEVLLRNKRRDDRKGGKFEIPWKGPYVIYKKLPNNTCILKTQAGVILNKKHNVCNLMKYRRPSYHNKFDTSQKNLNMNNSQTHSDADGNMINSNNNSCNHTYLLSNCNTIATNNCNAGDDKNMSTLVSCSSDTQVLTDLNVFPLIPLTIAERKKLALYLDLKLFAVPTIHGGLSNMKPNITKAILPDGNCYFRAISYLLTGSQREHTKVRNAVVQFMRSTECSANLQIYLAQNVQDYLNVCGVNNDAIWATDAEIMATAGLLKTDIMVWCKYGSEHRWCCYPSSFSLKKLSPNVIMLLHDYDHFSVILSIK